MNLLASNIGIFDLWTIVHLLAGFLAIWFFVIQLDWKNRTWPVLILLLVFFAWEILELGQPSGGFGGAETGLNILSDMVAAIAGGLIAFWLADKRPDLARAAA